MTLASVTRGIVERPMRVLIYGVEGCGKSTFAAKAPEPIFLGEPDGSAQIDTTRYPEPQDWQDVKDAVHTLLTEQHGYRTLVLDTLDWLEMLCWRAVCEKGGLDSIEDAGFGKGYTAALEEWRGLLAMLERARGRGMHVVLVAHSQIKPFKNPEDEDFDRYELKLHGKTAGLLKGWCDTVLFARHLEFAVKDGKTKRVRGVSDGSRVVHTTRTPAYDAKNRYDLPPTMPLDWATFEAAVKAHRPAEPGVLKAEIEKLLATEHGAPLAERVRAAVAKAEDDAAQLAKIADHLSAQVNLKAQESGR